MGPLRGLINESFCTKLFENLRKVGLSLERIHFVPVSKCSGRSNICCIEVVKVNHTIDRLLIKGPGPAPVEVG